MGAFDKVNEDFETWFEFNRDKLNLFYKTVGQRMQDFKLLPVEYYIKYSDNVADILLDIHEMALRAAEYQRSWIAAESERLTSAATNPEHYDRYLKMQPKTLLDFLKNTNSNEKRIADLLDAMLKTIEHNSSQCQSKLKWMQK